MSPLTEAKKRANEKYLAKLVQIVFRVRKEDKERILQHADTQGESLNAFITRAVNETIERDKEKTP